MKGASEFLGDGLIGVGSSGGIRFQVNLDFSLGRDVSGFRIVSEIVAVDAVEARGITSVEHDVDVVQLGAVAEFESLEIASLNGEERALAVGLGILVAGGSLLNVDPHLARNPSQHAELLEADAQIHPGDHHVQTTAMTANQRRKW